MLDIGAIVLRLIPFSMSNGFQPLPRPSSTLMLDTICSIPERPLAKNTSSCPFGGESNQRFVGT